MRCCNGSYGEFQDLLVYGSELLACTSKGLYVSTNEGRSFAPRCTNSSYGNFLNLQEAGTELLANTSFIISPSDPGLRVSRRRE